MFVLVLLPQWTNLCNPGSIELRTPLAQLVPGCFVLRVKVVT